MKTIRILMVCGAAVLLLLAGVAAAAEEAPKKDPAKERAEAQKAASAEEAPKKDLAKERAEAQKAAPGEEAPKKDPAKERAEAQKKENKERAVSEVAQCRDALAKGERGRATSAAASAYYYDPENRDALLLSQFACGDAAVPPGNEQMRERFAQKVSFDFVETPLPDVMAFVQCITRTTVIVDPKVLKDSISKTEVTSKPNDIPLSEAMDAMAKQYGWGCVSHDGAVLITDAESAKAMKNEAGPCIMRECRVQLLGLNEAVKPAFAGYAFSAPESIFCANDDLLVLKIAGDPPIPTDAAAAEARGKRYRDAELPKWMPAMKAGLMARFYAHSHQTGIIDALVRMKKESQLDVVFDEVAAKNSRLSGMCFASDCQPLCRTLNWAAFMLDFAAVARNNQIVIAPKDELSADGNAQQYEFSFCSVELRKPADEVKTQFTGAIFSEPKTGLFFIIASDAEGRELSLKGMVGEPVAQQNDGRAR